jgi:putative transposase
MTTKTNYISTNRSKHYLLLMIFDFDIEVMETDKDHVHFLIRYIPRWSIAQIVRWLKQLSTFHIWQLHSTALRKQF